MSVYIIIYLLYIEYCPWVFSHHASIQYFPILNAPTRPCLVLDNWTFRVAELPMNDEAFLLMAVNTNLAAYLL